MHGNCCTSRARKHSRLFMQFTSDESRIEEGWRNPSLKLKTRRNIQDMHISQFIPGRVGSITK